MDIDKQMSQNDNPNNREQPYIFEYDALKRFLIILVFFFMSFLGWFFILVNNWFTIVFGGMLLLVGLLNVVDAFLFKKLTINHDLLIKEWHFFGSKSIPLMSLKATVSKRLWSGTIFFRDRNISSWNGFLMNFETFPIGNNGFRKIKKILIDKKIITGDEYEWLD